MLSSSAPSFSLKSCPVIISCKFVTAVTHLEIHAPFYNLCRFPSTICHCGLLPFVQSPPILKCRMLNGPNITYIYCFIYGTNNYSIRLHLLRCCNSTTYDLNETANQLRHLFRCIVLFNANSRTYLFQCLQSNIYVSTLTVEHMCFNAYTRTYVFQCLHSNICVSMLTVKHMCFNAYSRTYVFQRLHSNICVSTLTLEHMCFNAYIRTYVFQCLQSNICVSMLTVEHMCFNAYSGTYVVQWRM